MQGITGERPPVTTSPVASAGRPLPTPRALPSIGDKGAGPAKAFQANGVNSPATRGPKNRDYRAKNRPQLGRGYRGVAAPL